MQYLCYYSFVNIFLRCANLLIKFLEGSHLDFPAFGKRRKNSVTSNGVTLFFNKPRIHHIMPYTCF